MKSVTLAYFSPTETTKKVLEGIAETIGAEEVKKVDLTPADTMSREFPEVKDGIALLGAPVYAGRIPEVAGERFGKLKGNGVPAVIIVLYGNREYEDALIELREIAVKQGFKPIAGAAFIGEHSFTSDDYPLSPGRPDAQDINIARDLGEKIAEKLANDLNTREIPELQVPGNLPPRERRPRDKRPPETDTALCTMCLTCVEICPTAAITVNEGLISDPELCISCCACVKKCPAHAKAMNSPHIDRVRVWLSDAYGKRKEPEIFLN